MTGEGDAADDSGAEPDEARTDGMDGPGAGPGGTNADAADGPGTDQDGTNDGPSDGLLLDVMLGKLVTYLRMCGYDAAYAVDRGIEADDALLAQASAEGRVLVSRDRELVDRAEESLLVGGRTITDQLAELRRAGFDLELPVQPTYCSACNGDLEAVDRTEPTPEYAPSPHDREVWRCRKCGQHFWKGSHWDDVAATLEDL